MCEFCSPDPKIECCVCGRKAKKAKKPVSEQFKKMKRYNPQPIVRLFMGWFSKVYR